MRVRVPYPSLKCYCLPQAVVALHGTASTVDHCRLGATPTPTEPVPILVSGE
jgi:hypothetical protein